MDAARLRAAFPVLAQRAYLNAGTCGPVPSASLHAGSEAHRLALEEGRSGTYYQRLADLRERLRAAYAGVLGARTEDVALATGTSEAMVRVLTGLDLAAGDEVLTADDEHPGLLGPLAALRDRAGVTVRTAPLATLAEHVTPATRLIACSHVSWMTGTLAPVAELAATGVPLLLDGAQGAGAIRVEPEALGCAFYTAAGQKWLCGPVGTGMLWVAPAWRERLHAVGPTYVALADPADALGGALRADAGRHDTASMSLATVAAALAAHDVLADAGWDAVRERAAALAGRFAQALRDQGHHVRDRGPTTLVAWDARGDAEAEVARLAELGIVLRWLPGGRDLRVAVGAWNDEDDLDRLLAGLQRRR